MTTTNTKKTTPQKKNTPKKTPTPQKKSKGKKAAVTFLVGMTALRKQQRKNLLRKNAKHKEY